MVAIPEGVFQCKLRWSLTGDREEMISTIAVKDDEGEPRQADQVAKAVYEAWLGAFEPSTLCDDYAFVGVDVTEGAAGPGDGMVVSYDKYTQGGGAWQCVPSNCALLVRKKTQLGGRHNTGRMYLPGGYLSDQACGSTGEVLPIDFNQIQGYLNQFFANLIDDSTAVGDERTGFMPMLLHVATEIAPTVISSLILDRIIGTQRQRMRR